MKNRIPLFATVVLIFLVYVSFFFGACVKSNVPPTNDSTKTTITALISSATNLTVLDSALKQTHLDTLFNNTGPYTYFVATNAAYASVGISSTLLLSLPDSQLERILLYSAIPGSVLSSRLPVGPDAPLKTETGDSIFVTNNGVHIYVNGIQLVTEDAIASNGVIDAVSFPLFPPAGNIMQVAQSDTSFSFFVAAANRTAAGEINVASVLSGNTVYTLLLPINAAFQAAGYATIADINNANPDTLARILEYNILPGRIFTSDFVNNQVQATSIYGLNVTLVVLGLSDGFAVQGDKAVIPAVIGAANIMATNGVIHGTNELLIP